MTISTAATIEIVQIQDMRAANVSFLGKHNAQQTICGNAINATVHIA
jgi:hypothetical protein